MPTSRRDARERRALNRGRSKHDVSVIQFHEPGVTARPISRWCALTQFEVLFPTRVTKCCYKNSARRARPPAIDYETIENDARTLMLTNVRVAASTIARGTGAATVTLRIVFQKIVGIACHTRRNKEIKRECAGLMRKTVRR